MSDRPTLERAIAELVVEYETLHSCEVSSLWISHFDTTRTVEVTVTTRDPVKVA